MEVTVYLNSSKEDMYDQGLRAGLSEEALHNFMYTLYEVEFLLDVNEKDGSYKILKVNGRPLLKHKE